MVLSIALAPPEENGIMTKQNAVSAPKATHPIMIFGPAMGSYSITIMLPSRAIPTLYLRDVISRIRESWCGNENRPQGRPR
jgi:hypothetical protein